MTDYIPNDIPKPVIEYINKHSRYNGSKGVYFKYLTDWKGEEIYVYSYIYNKPTAKGLPQSVFYNCKEVRKPTIEETWEIHNLITIVNLDKNKPVHICGQLQ